MSGSYRGSPLVSPIIRQRNTMTPPPKKIAVSRTRSQGGSLRESPSPVRRLSYPLSPVRSLPSPTDSLPYPPPPVHSLRGSPPDNSATTLEASPVDKVSRFRTGSVEAMMSSPSVRSLMYSESPVVSPRSRPLSASPSAGPLLSPRSRPMPSPSASPLVSPRSRPMPSPSASPLVSPRSRPMPSPSASPLVSPRSRLMTSPSEHPLVSPIRRSMTSSPPSRAHLSSWLRTPPRHLHLPRVSGYPIHQLYYPRFSSFMYPSLLLSSLLPIAAGSAILSSYGDRYYGQNGLVYEKVFVPTSVTTTIDPSMVTEEYELSPEGEKYVAVYSQVPIIGQELDVDISGVKVRYVIEDIMSDADYLVTYKLRKVDDVAPGPTKVIARQKGQEINYFIPSY